MEERRMSLMRDRRSSMKKDRRKDKTYSYDAMHVTMWIAAVFCSTYVVLLFYYFLMPISHWVALYDVYPVKTVYEVGEDIRYISHIHEKRMSDHKFVDTMFCKRDGKEKFIRHDQQTQENFAEGPQPEMFYEFPFKTPVEYPGVCYLDSSLILQSPMGHTKSKKMFGNKGDSVHLITIIAKTK
jgi:hypothetical protein